MNAYLIRKTKQTNSRTNERGIVFVDKFFFAIACLFIDSLLSLFYSSISIFLCGLIGCFITLFLSRGLDKKAIKWLVIGKIIATIVVLIIYYSCINKYGLPYYIGGSDDAHSERDAVHFVSTGMVFPWDWDNIINDSGFVATLGWIMRIVGVSNYHTLCYRVLNCYFWISVAAIVYKICNVRIGFSNRQSLMVMVVLMLFPNALYLSSFVFRDTLNALIFVLCFALLDDTFRKRKQKAIISNSRVLSIFIVCLLTFYGYWVRSEILYFVIFFALISLLRDWKLSYKNVVFILSLMLILYFAFGYFGFWALIEQKINLYTQMRADWALTESSNAIFQLIFTLPLFPIGIILRVIYGLVYPLPTALLHFYDIFTDGLAFIDFLSAIGVCFQIIAIPFLFLNFRKIDKYVLAYSVIFLSFVISTFTFRHVLLFYPFLVILLARQFFFKNKHRRNLVCFGCIMLAIMVFMYGVSKLI